MGAKVDSAQHISAGTIGSPSAKSVGAQAPTASITLLPTAPFARANPAETELV